MMLSYRNVFTCHLLFESQNSWVKSIDICDIIYLGQLNIGFVIYSAADFIALYSYIFESSLYRSCIKCSRGIFLWLSICPYTVI